MMLDVGEAKLEWSGEVVLREVAFRIEHWFEPSGCLKMGLPAAWSFPTPQWLCCRP